MKRWKDPFPQTPKGFHDRVEQTLGGLQDTDMTMLLTIRNILFFRTSIFLSVPFLYFFAFDGQFLFMQTRAPLFFSNIVFPHSGQTWSTGVFDVEKLQAGYPVHA